MSGNTEDPIVEGIKSAAVHLGKAGFEVLAAAGAIASGISRKVRPSEDPPGHEPDGRERITVD